MGAVWSLLGGTKQSSTVVWAPAISLNQLAGGHWHCLAFQAAVPMHALDIETVQLVTVNAQI